MRPGVVGESPQKDRTPVTSPSGGTTGVWGWGPSGLSAARKSQVVRTLLYLVKSSRMRPVPRTTEVSGSSSTRSGQARSRP